MRPPRTRRGPAALAATVLLCLSLTACSSQVRGTPLASFGTVDPGTVAGLPVTEGPSGLRPDVPTADLAVRNEAGTMADTLAVDALADIYQYWRQTMPAQFGGQRFHAPDTLVSFDSNVGGVQVCGRDSKDLVNAMYCPEDNSIDWDRGILLPYLMKQFGPLAVLTVLAHEMGHDVQFQLGAKSGITGDEPSIVVEQQADCYAGSFFRWAAQGNATHFRLSTGRGLNTVLAAIFMVRDKVGAHDPNEQGAHGSAFDRVYAFQVGFAEGPKRCAAINLAEVRSRVTEGMFQTTSARRTNGNLPINEHTITLLQHSLDWTFSGLHQQEPVIRIEQASCPDGSRTPPATYCPNENIVAVDLAALRAIATPPTRQGITSGAPNSPGGIGDFAAFAEVASRYVLGVQHQLGIPLNDTQAGLRTACLTGVWAGVTNNHGQRLHLATGDLDEAVSELLTARSIISADVRGRDVPSGFARVAAFRTGFLSGASGCTSKFK